MRSRVEGFVAHKSLSQSVHFCSNGQLRTPCRLSETSRTVAEPELFSYVGQCVPDTHGVHGSPTTRVCCKSRRAAVFARAAYELTLMKSDVLRPALL